jgi:hypothetical protein
MALGQKIYTPEGGVRPSKGKVDIELVRLLAPQESIDQNVSAERVAAYILRVEKSVAASVPPNAAPFRLDVRVTLSATARPKFDLRYDHEPPQNLLQKIYDDFQKLPDERSKKDPVPFEIDFVIRAKP